MIAMATASTAAMMAMISNMETPLSRFNYLLQGRTAWRQSDKRREDF